MVEVSPFDKRVKLLEKWDKNRKAHTLDMYGIADLILDVWQEAEADTEGRILDMLRRWDSTPVDADDAEYNLKVFDEMHRAFTIGFDYGEEAREERILWLLKDLEKTTFPGDVWNINPFTYAIQMIDRLGEQK